MNTFFKDIKERIDRLMVKLDNYRAKAPERLKAKIKRQTERDERLFTRLSMQAKIEEQRTEIEKHKATRELARLKVRVKRESSRPKSSKTSGISSNYNNLFSMSPLERPKPLKRGKSHSIW